MLHKNIFIVAFIILGFLTPNFLLIQASDTIPVAKAGEERIILLKQLLEKVRAIQIQLETLIKDESLNASPISEADYTLGKTNARVKILTFTDFECPYCKMFHTTLETILKNNPDISVTYRHFPLEQLHSNAKELAVTAECAGQIKGDIAFFSVVDSIFNSRSVNEGTDMNLVSSFITKAGVSNKLFKECMAGKVAENAVNADMTDGLGRGMQGTPQSYLYKDGKFVGEINGAQPLDAIQAQISDLLK